MQKWEYMIVKRFDGRDGKYYVRWLNDSELPNWQHGPDIFVYLLQVGAMGWELICVEGASFYFKRPIE